MSREEFQALLNKHKIGEDYDLRRGAVGKGWWPILENAFTKMKAAGWDGEVRQIKEKFGGLRLYIGAASKEVHKMTDALGAKSYKTCEDCGEPGWCQDVEGWYVTLCPLCRCTKWKERLDRNRREGYSKVIEDFKCAMCGSEDTDVVVSYEQFTYGMDSEPHTQLQLNAVIPHFNCNVCSFSWTDHRAETSRELSTTWLHRPLKKYQDRTFAGVALILKRGDKRLMGKRKGSHGAGTWSFPGGGMDRSDQDMFTAARRELHEETGIWIQDIKRIKFVAANDTYHKDGDVHWVTLLMEVEYGEDELEPELREPDKCEKWEWVHKDDPPQPLFMPVQKFLDEGGEL